MKQRFDLSKPVAVPYNGHQLYLSQPEFNKVLGVYEMLRNLDVDVPVFCEWIAKHSDKLQELTDLKQKLREVTSDIKNISHTLRDSPLTKY